MANTYTQMNIQAVFAVKGRENFLHTHFRIKLFEYISGILKGIKQYEYPLLYLTNDYFSYL